MTPTSRALSSWQVSVAASNPVIVGVKGQQLVCAWAVLGNADEGQARHQWWTVGFQGVRSSSQIHRKLNCPGVKSALCWDPAAAVGTEFERVVAGHHPGGDGFRLTPLAGARWRIETAVNGSSPDIDLMTAGTDPAGQTQAVTAAAKRLPGANLDLERFAVFSIITQVVDGAHD